MLLDQIQRRRRGCLSHPSRTSENSSRTHAVAQHPKAPHTPSTPHAHTPPTERSMPAGTKGAEPSTACGKTHRLTVETQALRGWGYMARLSGDRNRADAETPERLHCSRVSPVFKSEHNRDTPNCIPAPTCYCRSIWALMQTHRHRRGTHVFSFCDGPARAARARRRGAPRAAARAALAGRLM